MKKSTSKTGNKDKQTSHVRLEKPLQHDTPVRLHPPTPQDIHRVQPVSQPTGKVKPANPETSDKPGNSKRRKSN